VPTHPPTHLPTHPSPGPVVADDVAKMPFIAGCINEALRCYSAAPNTRRIAAEDAVVGGYAIPKGTSLILDIWAMHRWALGFCRQGPGRAPEQRALNG
jgi:cytochrome P450